MAPEDEAELSRPDTHTEGALGFASTGRSSSSQLAGLQYNVYDPKVGNLRRMRTGEMVTLSDALSVQIDVGNENYLLIGQDPRLGIEVVLPDHPSESGTVRMREGKMMIPSGCYAIIYDVGQAQHRVAISALQTTLQGIEAKLGGGTMTATVTFDQPISAVDPGHYERAKCGLALARVHRRWFAGEGGAIERLTNEGRMHDLETLEGLIAENEAFRRTFRVVDRDAIGGNRLTAPENPEGGIEKIGQGAMGQVWLAVNVPLQQPEAIKTFTYEMIALGVITERAEALRRERGITIPKFEKSKEAMQWYLEQFPEGESRHEEHRSLHTQAWAQYQDCLRRFDNEIQLIASLRNKPNIIQIYNGGKGIDFHGKEVRWVSMQYVHGDTAKNLLNASKLSKEDKGKVLYDTLRAIANLGKIRHNDIKGDNVMVEVSHDGKVRGAYLLDFGVASQAGIPLGGTPTHMSPELWTLQALGANAAARITYNERQRAAAQTSAVLPPFREPHAVPNNMEEVYGIQDVVSAASDLFSLGVMGYAMFADPNGYKRWDVNSGEEYLHMNIGKLAGMPKDEIRKGLDALVDPIDAPYRFKQLLKVLLHPDPEQRTQFEERKKQHTLQDMVDHMERLIPDFVGDDQYVQRYTKILVELGGFQALQTALTEDKHKEIRGILAAAINANPRGYVAPMEAALYCYYAVGAFEDKAEGNAQVLMGDARKLIKFAADNAYRLQQSGDGGGQKLEIKNCFGLYHRIRGEKYEPPEERRKKRTETNEGAQTSVQSLMSLIQVG